MHVDDLLAEGWHPLPATDFSALVGPFLTRRDAEGLTVGFLAEQRHGNGHLGVVHGGLLMTFADNALGCAVADELGHVYCATLQLQYHFTASARIGEFVTCRAEVTRRTNQLVFVRGLIMAGERTVGMADGMWKILSPEGAERLKAG